MKKYALIGGNIASSLSPVIQNYYYQQLHIDAEYQLLNLDSKLSFNKIAEIKKRDLDGFNVTSPFKVDIIKYLNGLSPIAEKIKSVNTVICQDGRWMGDNTDYIGLQKSIEIAGLDLKGKTALLLGAGGAARTIVYSLIEAGVKSILVYARDRLKTNKFVLGIRRDFAFDNIMSVYDTYGLVSDLVINATPLGSNVCPNITCVNLAEMHLEYFLDLNYSLDSTINVKQAKALGIEASDGIVMLATQSLASLQLWLELRFTPDEFNTLIKGAIRECQA